MHLNQARLRNFLCNKNRQMLWYSNEIYNSVFKRLVCHCIYFDRIFKTFLDSLLRLPVGRGGVLNSPRFWVFFSMSKFGPPLMGDIAGFPLLFSALLHII